jgi:DNA-directed RNA polymerase subunit RPC12/RpoP
MNNRSFRCCKCGKKLSFSKVFQLKRESNLTCPICGTKLIANYSNTFNWGFKIAFFSVLAPGQFIYLLTRNIRISLYSAIIASILVIIGVAYYVYSTTKLIETKS